MRGILAIGSLLALGCTTQLPLRSVLSPPQEPSTSQVAAVASPALPAPRGLRARSGELRLVPLSWTPILTGEVAGYQVERSVDGVHFEPIGIAEGRFGSTFVDRGYDLAGGSGALADGSEYHYRVRAVDALGRASSEASPAVVATTAAAPAPPEGLRSFNLLPRQVAITWQPSEDPSVHSYLVSRSPAARGPFEVVARVEGRFRTRFLDRGLGDLRVLYYQVAAVNRAGAVGPPSEPVLAVTKAEPLPPADLRLTEKHLGVNVLEWEPNVEPDIQGYRVLRHRGEKATPEIVAVVDASTTRIVDPRVGAGEDVSYTIIAFDADGLESLPTDPVRVVSEDYDLTAEARDGAVHLHWDPEIAEDFDRARIYRGGLLGMQEIAQVPSEGFIDTRVAPGKSYRYVVRLEREGTGPAPPSGEVEIRLPEKAPGPDRETERPGVGETAPPAAPPAPDDAPVEGTPGAEPR